MSVAPQENYAAGFKGLTGKWRDASADGGLESGEVHGEVCDFGDLNAVAELSKKLAKRFDGDRVDGVLLNAGIGINAFKLTKDGYEWVVPAAKQSGESS